MKIIERFCAGETMTQLKQPYSKVVRIDAEVYEALREQARDERRNVGEVATWAIKEYIRLQRSQGQA